MSYWGHLKNNLRKPNSIYMEALLATMMAFFAGANAYGSDYNAIGFWGSLTVALFAFLLMAIGVKALTERK